MKQFLVMNRIAGVVISTMNVYAISRHAACKMVRGETPFYHSNLKAVEI